MMDLEKTSKPGIYIARTSEEENSAIAATYREHITAKAICGEEISDLELALSESDISDTTSRTAFRIGSSGIQPVLDALNAFSHNTPQAVENISTKTGIPPFKNRYIAERIRYGKVAQALASEMLSKALNFDLGVE